MADEMTSNALESQTLSILVDMLKSATTPDALQAQTILLRRMALQGDVTGSRVPAPANITQIGGYLNLLDTLQQPEIRAQVLTAILGVAGPNPPLGWLSTKTPLSMVTLSNYRPECPSQPAIPLTFAVRADFVATLQQAISDLHDRGCSLPLLSPTPVLPQATPGVTTPADTLAILGRALSIVPATALRDHTTDPIVLARLQGSAEPFQVMARVLSPGKVPVASNNWDVLECNDVSCTPTAVNDAQYVPVGPFLARAGFYANSSLLQPDSLASVGWARFTNVTGLVAGITKLGDELSLLYTITDINGSVFASRLHWIWNGTSFVARL